MAEFHCYSCRQTKKAEAMSEYRSGSGRPVCKSCHEKVQRIAAIGEETRRKESMRKRKSRDKRILGFLKSIGEL